MDFHLLPAVDVSQGRLALFRGAERVLVGEFGGDPLAAARAFVATGAEWAHVVDMDLAFDGVASNLSVVQGVVAEGLRVQASGGVTTRSEINSFLEAGAERVVLGSGALSDRGRVERLVAEFGEALVIGLEVNDDRVTPRGAAAGAVYGLSQVLSWIAGVPVSRVLVTAVERVGELSGPDLKAIGTVNRALTAPVMAAGGVATLEQIQLLRAAGVEAVVLGRAALEGSLDLAEAFRQASAPARDR